MVASRTSFKTRDSLFNAPVTSHDPCYRMVREEVPPPKRRRRPKTAANLNHAKRNISSPQQFIIAKEAEPVDEKGLVKKQDMVASQSLQNDHSSKEIIQ